MTPVIKLRDQCGLNNDHMTVSSCNIFPLILLLFAHENIAFELPAHFAKSVALP